MVKPQQMLDLKHLSSDGQKLLQTLIKKMDISNSAQRRQIINQVKRFEKEQSGCKPIIKTDIKNKHHRCLIQSIHSKNNTMKKKTRDVGNSNTNNNNNNNKSTDLFIKRQNSDKSVDAMLHAKQSIEKRRLERLEKQRQQKILEKQQQHQQQKFIEKQPQEKYQNLDPIIEINRKKQQYKNTKSYRELLNESHHLVCCMKKDLELKSKSNSTIFDKLTQLETILVDGIQEIKRSHQIISPPSCNREFTLYTNNASSFIYSPAMQITCKKNHFDWCH